MNDTTIIKNEITILFIWRPDERLKEHFKEQLKHLSQVKLIFPSNKETLIKSLPEADIIIGWDFTKELSQLAKKMSLFILIGAGTEHIIPLFREIAEEKSITLLNTHGNSYAVAQHTIALLLSLTNKIIPHHNWMLEGKWYQGDFKNVSIPLRDRKIGLLGYGAINQKVHKFLSNFELDFKILRRDWSKQKTPLPTSADKYTYTELHKFLEDIDILIIALPHTKLTNGLIKTKELELLGSNGLLITVARGPIIDEKSLYEALKNKIIAGASIDVWYDYEPITDEKGKTYPYSYPFYKLENVILSPHRGASPLNNIHNWDDLLENINRFVKGENKFINVVNLKNEY